MNPNDIYSYCVKGWLFTSLGNLEEGISCEKTALRLSPRMPDGCLYSTGVAHYLAKRYDEAIATIGKMSYLPIEVQGCIAACYAQLGRDEDASAAAAEFLDRAKMEFAVHPGDDVDRWRTHWRRMMPLDDPAGREHLYDGLRKAGLPV